MLEALDASVLEANECWFGGGTAIALLHGEYRESLDVDFLVSSASGYRSLRQRLTGRGGLAAIRGEGRELIQARVIRADQYGIRTFVAVDGVEIKLEIVHEGRIELERAEPPIRVCGVATLTALDMAASKLLASSDRWADPSVYSRDLIDLAMMKLDRAVLRSAGDKARAAYGVTVDRDLTKAIEALRAVPERLEVCMRALKMLPPHPRLAAAPPAVVWKQIRRLLPPVPRRRGRRA